MTATSTRVRCSAGRQSTPPAASMTRSPLGTGLARQPSPIATPGYLCPEVIELGSGRSNSAGLQGVQQSTRKADCTSRGCLHQPPQCLLRRHRVLMLAEQVLDADKLFG